MAISRFLSRLRPQTPFPALPQPEHPVCIIGDVHGRADLLDTLVLRLCAEKLPQGSRVILVGDLIDRGPDSAGVLERVRDWCTTPAPFAQVHCLMGNHERMLLDFLDDPTQHGPRWLSNGGDATVESYGLVPFRRLPGATATDSLGALRDELAAALPDGMHHWLQQRPLVWQEDRLVVTHAGADPSRPIDDQPSENHLWGHHDFRIRPRSDGLWVAHGHIIIRPPNAMGGRIAVDTGAWRTDCLTAAVLDTDGVRFVSTSAPDTP